MNMILNTVILLAQVESLVAIGCKRPYSPPAITQPNNYLVVEGVIAAGQDSTIINLSRTVNVSSQTISNPELGATVTVEGNQNVSYTLQPDSNGRYVSPPLNLDNSHQYRLHIVTADGKVYESDYEPVKITPPIDSLQEDITNKGISLYTDAHDPTNNTRYYRWDYTETYIYQSEIESLFVYDPAAPDLQKSALRTPDQQVHTCYISLNSSTILLNSSAALSQDVIQNNPITFIPKDSEKILHRYSIIVRQYALTQEAYQFWTQLKRNTQQIGTIFDVQPSEVQSNLHCISDPSTPVLGYISVSSVSTKRIFIDRSQLPAWPYPIPQCKPDTICWPRAAASPPDELKSGIYIPLAPMDTTGICEAELTPAYTLKVAYYTCADCRFHLGGKTKKPDFWIDQ
ncbi:MAG TPA: DUF4249 domain-containing protein [Mucilaginibacter sp.]|nr:DUF4249 domain-containing protein [Mucilaginibacter sp.]